MAHGDRQRPRAAARLAPTQCVVLLVKDADGAGDTAARLTDELKAAGVRAQLDARVDTSFGRRATDWEIKGVPLRLEVGPRDLRGQRHARAPAFELEGVGVAHRGSEARRRTGGGRASGDARGGHRVPRRAHARLHVDRRGGRGEPRGLRPRRMGTPSGSRAKRSSPSRRSRSVACSGPTARCPRPTTSPISSPSAPCLLTHPVLASQDPVSGNW